MIYYYYYVGLASTATTKQSRSLFLCRLCPANVNRIELHALHSSDPNWLYDELNHERIPYTYTTCHEK